MENQQIKISVIINTYNVSEYIERSLLSVFPQLTDEMELIIVDDNSTDSTIDTIRKIVKETYNIHFIFENQNKGISAERNKGILKAVGKYILFIDGDDYISSTALSKLIDIIDRDEFDIVGYNMQVVPDYVHSAKLNNREKKYSKPELKDGVYTKDQLIRSLFKNELKHNPFSYLFKRQIFLAHDIFFPTAIQYGEDYATIYRFFNFVKKGLITNERFYNYVQRKSSATHKPRLKYAQDNLNISCDILKYYENTKYYNGAKGYVIPRLITALSIAMKVKSSKSRLLGLKIENEINLLTQKNNDLGKYLSNGLRLKVYLNRNHLLKYIYYCKGLG